MGIFHGDNVEFISNRLWTFDFSTFGMIFGDIAWAMEPARIKSWIVFPCLDGHPAFFMGIYLQTLGLDAHCGVATSHTLW